MRAMLVAASAAVVLAVAAWLVLGRSPRPADTPGLAPRAADREVERATSPRTGLTDGSRVPLLRVMLWQADMRTPAADRPLAVYSFRPGKMELPVRMRTTRTGDDGGVELSDLPAGSYIVCVEGAVPGSRAPRSARATLGDEAQTIHLVEPTSSTRVQFDVQAQFTPRFGVASKLLLRRVDDGRGELFEQPTVFRPGLNSFELLLPPGRYEIGVLPLGELLVDRGDRDLSVGREPMRVSVPLRENLARIDVVLEGLPGDQLPARVYPQPVDSLLIDRPERLWWGPFKWHSAELQVPALSGLRRLLVVGRTATFRSRQPVDLSGDRQTVVLEPAVRVVVDWFGWDSVHDAEAVVVATAGGEEVARSLAPRFGEGYPWLDRPALGGELVLPRAAELQLECRRADGSLAWERAVVPGAEPVFVRID